MNRLLLLVGIPLSFGFYYSNAGGADCLGVEHFGFAGMQTLLFWFSYYVTCVYVYHIGKLKITRDGRQPNSLNLALIIIPVITPIAMIGVVKGGCYFSLNYVSFFLLVPLTFLIVDRSGAIRKRVVGDFECRTHGRGGGLFDKYPPNNMVDIYFRLAGFLILIVVISLISSIK